jgi:hypothetical protein
MSQRHRSPLTWRPIVPGSDQHLALMGRTRTDRERLGRVLYPGLYARRDEEHRRACDAIAAAARRNSERAPELAARKPSVPPAPVAPGDSDGRFTECA